MTTKQPRSPMRRLLRPLSITVGAIIAAACATTPSDVPTGAAKQALGTTVCNEGSRTAPVSPRWSAAYTGVRAASDLLAAEVANNTSDDIEVRIELRGRGLDKREAVRTLFAGPILRGNKQVLSIAPSTFPVQSIGAKSTATIETTITKSSTQAHLVGLKVRSAPLGHTFATGYGQVTLSADDITSSATAIEGDPTSLDDLARRMAPFLRAMRTATGRVWNGAAFADVATLPASTDDFGGTIGQTVTFGAGDAGKLDKFMTPIPYTPSPTGPTFCYRLPGEYIDQGLGEGATALDRAASFGTAFVQDTDGKVVWSGNLDSAGCTPRLSNINTAPGNGYGMFLQSSLNGGGRQVSIRGKNGGTSSTAMFFSLNGAKGFATQLPAWDLHFKAFPTFAQILRIGNVGPGQTSALAVPTGLYKIVLDFCANNPNAGTACASGDTLFLGPNPDNTHNVDWKFVVAHEFGHLMQDRLSGTPDVPGVPDPYSAPEGNPLCGCAQAAEGDRAHCMQSREFTGATEREGFAHYVATNTWNGRSATACKFVYYKPFFETSSGTVVLKNAPYPVDCTVKAKWLENKCGTDIAGLAVEWDWMNWKRSVDTAPSTENSTMADIADIYKLACGGGTCSGKQPTPPVLIDAAKVKYGVGTPRANRVELDVNRYGANH